MQTDFKTSSRAVIFFFFLRRRRIQFSPRAKCDTRNMFCREYTDSLMNCSGTLFHSACLRPVFFFPFPFLSWLSSDAGNHWKTCSTFMEVELRCQTRYVQSSNSASCMEANYSIRVHDLLASSKCLRGFTFTTAMTPRFPFKLRDAALIWNFQTYSYFNVIMQRGGGTKTTTYKWMQKCWCGRQMRLPVVASSWFSEGQPNMSRHRTSWTHSQPEHLQ